jgi:hypothetical protein
MDVQTGIADRWNYSGIKPRPSAGFEFELPVALARPVGGLGGRGQSQGETRKKLTFYFVCLKNGIVQCELSK